MTPNYESPEMLELMKADAASADAAAAAHAAVEDDGPEHVPGNAWVTMGIFAVFVIAFGTCASTFMFN